MITRTILISAAAVILAAMASPAKADHSRLAVTVHYGPAYVHYVERDRYFDGRHRYERVHRYRHDHWKAYRKHHKKNKHWRRHYARADWCPVDRRHWH